MEDTNWAEELSGTALPDRRYLDNFIKMAERLHKSPGLSFSAACGPLVRKSANRLFSVKEIDLQSGHRQGLNRRAAGGTEPLLVIEDTTDLNYSTHHCTDGLGDIGGGKPPKDGGKYLAGLSMHVAMVSTLSGLPLGLLGTHTWAPVNETRKSALLKKLPIEEKESIKWIHTLDWVAGRLRPGSDRQVYIVGDREGDFYEHYSLYTRRAFEGRVDLVVRLLHRQRNVLYGGQKVNVAKLAEGLQVKGQRRTTIRKPGGKKGREAVFDISHCRIVCPPSSGRKGPHVPMSLVRAVEREPPPGEDALEWLLLTTKEVDTLEQAIAIVEIYEKRWSIERFFFVLKQALRVERTQFDNFTRLSNALDVYGMVAWKLYRLSVLAKTVPQADATEHFEAFEAKVLADLTGRQIKMVRDYIMALASLVHFEPSKQQPLPGEQLLWQALKIFENIKRGVRLAHNYGTG